MTFDNAQNMPVCTFCDRLQRAYAVGYRCADKPEKAIKNPKDRPTWCPKIKLS